MLDAGGSVEHEQRRQERVRLNAEGGGPWQVCDLFAVVASSAVDTGFSMSENTIGSFLFSDD